MLISPPVQLSAVASVLFRALRRSPSAAGHGLAIKTDNQVSQPPPQFAHHASREFVRLRGVGAARDVIRTVTMPDEAVVPTVGLAPLAIKSAISAPTPDSPIPNVCTEV